MKKALFLYSTTDGQTLKICRYLQDKLSADFESTLLDINGVDKLNFEAYERVIIGASIRYGHFNKKLYRFINNNLDELNGHKVAFFCVNLTARKEEQGKDTPEGSAYMRTFLKKSPWIPKLQGVFAGALRYPEYKLIDRWCIQFIMKITGGETDPTKEVEYTNWEKVTKFAQNIKKM